ncbi:MAG TPA: ADP-ribosyl-[dinitrogen reductase] hydrolase [Plasticicumulans sp.]|nr:ADP-ribosyl-[dinitrogen reductase] hydrolase [Plasticicumulans sp.]
MYDSDVRDRALGAYLGLALGDALGATVEFLTAREIAAQHGRHDEIKGGGWLKLRAGAVTDDTQMSMALGLALIESGGWQLTAIAEAWAEWLRSKPADVGNTCRRGIRRYLKDGSLLTPESADAGNGAAMRNVPVTIVTLGHPRALVKRSLEQARFTHHNPLSDAATVTLGQMTQTLMLGGTTADCRLQADALIATHRQFRFEPYPGQAGGYIVDTVQTVFDAFFAEEDFEACLVRTVNRGGDADTTGAIVGQLAGARCGASRLPRRWLKKLDPSVHAAIVAQTDGLLALAAAAAAC